MRKGDTSVGAFPPSPAAKLKKHARKIGDAHFRNNPPVLKNFIKKPANHTSTW
jgi:hypothetical protein